MKINGWQRIGLVASVLWVAGAYFYSFNKLSTADGNLTAEINAPCFEAAQSAQDHARWNTCEAAAVNQTMDYIRRDRRQAVATALVPVPLAWFLVYLGISLVRWIRRGFAIRH